LEIVDSRIADWRITLADTIADNASSAAVVLGEWVPIRDLPPLPETTATLVVNDTVVGTGEGTAVMGDPAAAVAWLANALARYGTAIEPGQFVMSGLVHHGVVRRGRRPCVGRHQRARRGHREFRVRVEEQFHE
jgi:2-oxo-3-hexenedioate decarboxylase/2-keto-4-pentenoate hydratase